MIIHILIPIIIASTCTKVIAAVNSSSLDISKYLITPKPGQSLPKNYISVNFSPEPGLKFTSAVYGPLQIWQSNDPDQYIERAELGLSYCLPQLLTLHLTDGTNKQKIYFRWEKGNFMSEDENAFLSYDTILKGNDVVLDTSMYLELNKDLNTHAFQKGNKSIAGYEFDVVKPKVDYKLIGIISESDMIYRSDHSIKEVEIHRVSNKPKVLIVKDEKITQPKRFIYDGKWKECDEDTAQQFLIQINKEETKTHETVGHQHFAPLSPTGIFQTSGETLLTPLDLYTPQQLQSFNLDKELPALPVEFVPATSDSPNLLVLDLNEITSDFQTQASFLENYSLTKIVPKNQNQILQINESGCLVWNNENDAEINELVLYKRNELVLLLIVRLQDSRKTSFYYVRKLGKLTSCNKSEFEHLLENWRQGDYDKTVSYSIGAPINKNCFDDFNRLVDGVYTITVKPKDGLELVRVLNGSAEIVREQGETWKMLTVSIFGSVHRMLSINFEKNGKNHVKYYNCSSLFEELDNSKYSEVFKKFKSGINIHSNVIYDLSDPKIGLVVNQMDVFKESVPTSGFHVKMVNMGNSVLWKSTESRCTSVFSVPGDKPTLYKLNINTNGTLSQEYFRILDEKILKIKTIDEFEIMKKKIANNTKNPDNEFMISTIKFDGNLTYEPIVFDIATGNENVLSFSTMDHVVNTIYAANKQFCFKEIKFGQKTLWKSESNTFVTKFVIYYFEGNPALGKINVVNNGNHELVHYDFTGESPKLIDASQFDNKHNEIKNQVMKTEIKPPKYNALDILYFNKIKVHASRHQGLFTVDYTMKDETPFDMLLYGPEIIWDSENGEKAKKASITFYEMLPVIALITMEGNSHPTKYLSHLTSFWHDFDQSTFDFEFKKISTFEPNRRGFTLPDREETTSFDSSSNLDEFFTKRSFQSRTSFITTVLDGRNRIYSPDRLSFIRSINLYYHGKLPKLVSFREFNLFGYYFEHHFIYSNGWRRINFPKFEQIYNFFRMKKPKDMCKENEFIYDILQGDSNVTVSTIPDQKFGSLYTLNDPGKAICTVRMGAKVLWTSPEGKNLTKFYVYKDGNNPTLAKFQQEDSSKKLTESYLMLQGNDWVNATYDDFSNALNALIEKNLPSAPSTTSSATPQPFSQQSRRHSRTSTSPDIPSGTLALDITLSNDPNFEYKTGRCDRVVPFKEFKPKHDKTVKVVKDGQKVVWFDQNLSLVCLKVFLQNRTQPILMELLVKDPQGKQKYKFVMLDNNQWVSCDESKFDSILDTLIEIYKATANN